MSVPVSGRFESGRVTITGVATGYLDSSGVLDLVSSNGLSIKGNFVYVTRREGQGTFVASDGRSGAFSFVSTGRRGTGVGNLGPDKITFTFGM